MKEDSGMTLKPGPARANLFGAAAAVSFTVLVVLAAVGAATGVLPSTPFQRHTDALPASSEFTFDPSRAGGCAICGTVESIRSFQVRGDDADPGADKIATVVLGAAGGGPAGGEIEQNARKRQVYRVTVRMYDGSYRTVSISNPPNFTIGDKVRVIEGKLVRA
jgi:uncharacterized protein YcfJ